MSQGDLILYKSSGRWYERAIVAATHGPFVHVAIVADAVRVLAATAHGIDYDTLPLEDDMHVRVPLLSRATDEGIQRGLMWARQQKGLEYGWIDIVYQGLKFLAPNNPFRLSEAGHMDCSDFATRYLIQAGVRLPDDFTDTYTVTPNDLARLFGVIPVAPAGVHR